MWEERIITKGLYLMKFLTVSVWILNEGFLKVQFIDLVLHEQEIDRSSARCGV